jgi:hypothetical protein
MCFFVPTNHHVPHPTFYPLDDAQVALRPPSTLHPFPTYLSFLLPIIHNPPCCALPPSVAQVFRPPLLPLRCPRCPCPTFQAPPYPHVQAPRLAPLAPHDTAQVSLSPCRLREPGDASIAPALAQLPQLASLQLGEGLAGVHLSATRVAGGWRVLFHHFLQPGMASALARSFSGSAAPAGWQERQLAAEAAGQTSFFKVCITMPHGPSSQQASELASLGRALAAFDDVDLGLRWRFDNVDLDWWMGPAGPASAHALLQPVAARLVAFGLVATSSASVLLGALQQLVLPRLAELSFTAHDGCIHGTVTAVAGLDAPRLAAVTLKGSFAGSRAAVVAAVTALAVGRPQPVGPDGRPAGLIVAVGRAVLSDEELGEARAAVGAVRRPCCVTLLRL